MPNTLLLGRRPVYWSNRERSARSPLTNPRPALAFASKAGATWACTVPNTDSKAVASRERRALRGRMREVIYVLRSQRNRKPGVGFVVAGLFEPCTWVWQLAHARPCQMFTTFLPLVVAVTAAEACPGAAGGNTPRWPPTAPTPPVTWGVWHCWHRIGGRVLSMAATTLPCGLWQIAQSSCTGSCEWTNGPRFSAWQV